MGEASLDRTSALRPGAFGVAQVHLVEVPGEQIGFLAPLGAPDLDDHVAPVVGVLRAAAGP